jgi:hypothetical protein
MPMKGLRRLTATAIVLWCASASAQQLTPSDSTEDPKVLEAREHYARAIQLYRDLAFDAARSEFERAYQLAPTYKILYNLALVYAQQFDFVGALQYYERYLREGGSQLTDARRDEVLADVGRLKSKVGRVRVATNVGEVDISVDDAPAGTSAQPILVNPGRRKITATHAGRLPATKVMDVTSGDELNVTMALAEPPTRTIVVERASSQRVPWVGWIATGVFAVSGGVFAYLASRRANDLEDAKANPDADPTSLQDNRRTMRVFAVLADVGVAGALAAGGVSLYYTLKWARTGEDKSRNVPPPTASVRVHPTGISIAAKF